MLLLLSALCALQSGPVHAAPEAEQLFDCVIEPHALIKLGSPATGVVKEILVDRSDRVVKHQVVAYLESSVEEATVALSRGRARASGLIDAREAADEFGKRAVVCQAELYNQNALSQ